MIDYLTEDYFPDRYWPANGFFYWPIPGAAPPVPTVLAFPTFNPITQPAETRYVFVLCDILGVPQEFLDAYENAEVVLNENEIGALSMALPDDYDPDLFADGALVYVYRAPAGLGYKVLGDTAFKIIGVKFPLDEQGRSLIQFEAESMLATLRDAAIPYQEGNAFTMKLGAADNLAKAFVRENRGSLATDTARNFSQLSVVADVSAAQIILKDQTSKRSVLEVVKELSDQSLKLGTWMGFNIVVADPISGTFRFETYTTTSDLSRVYPGSPSPLLFGPYYGNISNVELNLDYSDEANSIYAAGPGDAGLQAFANAVDTTRATAGPFARREKVINASDALDAAALTSEAEGALAEARPRIVLSGDVIESDQTRYDVDYRLGTLITIEHKRRLYDSRLSQVSFRLARNGGGEQISIRATNIQ